ncbi:MAG: hypothetical protein MZV49_12840 [Rhodopseudomonas palustris]|nr:hypothetical protein [Rhodopseudomonas palustris]
MRVYRALMDNGMSEGERRTVHSAGLAAKDLGRWSGRRAGRTRRAPRYGSSSCAPPRRLQPASKPVEKADPQKMAYALPDKPSIAVLPFTNMSDDREQEYFADGLAEEIINALSKVDHVFVIARNSTFTYKGKPVKVQQVAEELGVRYVLEGSVRKAGEEVRITVQLVDALNGRHVFSESYDRDFKDILGRSGRDHHECSRHICRWRSPRENLRRYSAKGTKNLKSLS